jgi:hypothetical protein
MRRAVVRRHGERGADGSIMTLDSQSRANIPNDAQHSGSPLGGVPRATSARRPT